MEGLMSMLRRIALGACRDLHVFDELKEDIVQDVAVRVLRAGGLMPAAAHWQPGSIALPATVALTNCASAWFGVRVGVVAATLRATTPMRPLRQRGAMIRNWN